MSRHIAIVGIGTRCKKIAAIAGRSNAQGIVLHRTAVTMLPHDISIRIELHDPRIRIHRSMKTVYIAVGGVCATAKDVSIRHDDNGGRSIVPRTPEGVEPR